MALKKQKFNIEDVLGQVNQPTLVKFNSPVMVGGGDKSDKARSGSLRKGERLSNLEACLDYSFTKKEAEEIFNRIIPPREWIVEGNIWRQVVSSTPATRGDVVALEEQLNSRLKQKNAQVTGICSIRRELYAQCFDEIIRQVTINCTERGLLLLRVRDETNMTLNSYRAIFESSTAYGMRKILRALSNKKLLEARLEEVTAEKENIDLTAQELANKFEDLAIKFDEQQKFEEKRHYEEAQILRQSNEQLKLQLEDSIAPARKALQADLTK